MWNIFYSPHVQIMRRPSPCIVLACMTVAGAGAGAGVSVSRVPAGQGLGRHPGPGLAHLLQRPGQASEIYKWKKKLIVFDEIQNNKTVKLSQKITLVCCVLHPDLLITQGGS